MTIPEIKLYLEEGNARADVAFFPNDPNSEAAGKYKARLDIIHRNWYNLILTPEADAFSTICVKISTHKMRRLVSDRYAVALEGVRLADGAKTTPIVHIEIQ